MEPHEFHYRLDSLIAQARQQGLSPRHVKNALQQANREIGQDEWKSGPERERRRGRQWAGDDPDVRGFTPLESDL